MPFARTHVLLLCGGAMAFSCAAQTQPEPAVPAVTVSAAAPSAAVPPALVAPLMAPPNPRQAVPAVAPDDLPAAPGAANPWVLGLTMASSPSFTAGAARELSWRPVLAGRLGRWMLATSTARGMAGPELVGGLTTTVAATSLWSLGLGVRTTHGRSSGDDPTFSGLPDVSASVALRASARYTLAPGWRLTAAWQQDVFKQQGAHLNFGVGWSQPVGGGWLMDASAGLTWADARAMNTFYGVPADAARADRPAFNARAGWEQWGWGVGVSRALSLHWRLSGSIGRSTLLTDAARSPLTARACGTQAQLSVAYVGW
jgi:outer membrane scaffolding protein for murein synthesis (MipA/OmpV family)